MILVAIGGVIGFISELIIVNRLWRIGFDEFALFGLSLFIAPLFFIPNMRKAYPEKALPHNKMRALSLVSRQLIFLCILGLILVSLSTIDYDLTWISGLITIISGLCGVGIVIYLDVLIIGYFTT